MISSTELVLERRSLTLDFLDNGSARRGELFELLTSRER
jgi:hypothetical protein